MRYIFEVCNRIYCISNTSKNTSPGKLWSVKTSNPDCTTPMWSGHFDRFFHVAHIESITNMQSALGDVLKGIDNKVTGDFLAMDIRQALHHLDEITGELTTDNLLANIFRKFYVGK